MSNEHSLRKPVFIEAKIGSQVLHQNSYIKEITLFKTTAFKCF